MHPGAGATLRTAANDFEKKESAYEPGRRAGRFRFSPLILNGRILQNQEFLAFVFFDSGCWSIDLMLRRSTAARAIQFNVDGIVGGHLDTEAPTIPRWQANSRSKYNTFSLKSVRVERQGWLSTLYSIQGCIDRSSARTSASIFSGPS